MTFDYFSFKVQDAIGTAPPGQTLSQCLSTGNPALCALIHRSTGNGSLWTGDGYIAATNANISELTTSGMDIGADYAMKMESAGQLTFGILGTYLKTYATEAIVGLGSFDCVGLYGNTCGTPNPKWRHTARVTWASPYDFSLSGTWRYFGGVSDEGLSGQPQLTAAKISPTGSFPAMNYFDISANYNVTKNYSFRLGIRNLFDKDPPLAVTGAPFGNGNTYPVAYDALGRQLSLTFTAKF
jgi:iron complex outermembrane receptor protein